MISIRNFVEKHEKDKNYLYNAGSKNKSEGKYCICNKNGKTFTEELPETLLFWDSIMDLPL